MGDQITTNLLKLNSEKICNYIVDLKKNRDEVMTIIRLQEREKTEINLEIERLAYKIGNLTRGLAQRICARARYDEAIQEAEIYHKQLIDSSDAVLSAIQKDYDLLHETMDKKVGPDVDKM